MIKVMKAHPLDSLIKLQLKEAIGKEIKPVFKLHREYHLGQRPKTANYL
jgi:hypothetical protein